MAEQAYAYVTLIPVAKGFERALAKELGQADKPSKSAGDKAGEQFVDGFKGGFSAVMRTVATAGAVAVGAAATGLGVALNKGFDRLQNIERARNLLQGVGLDSVTVEKVMDNALTSVRGTAFGLDEAAQVAASAVAAGVEPGQNLERILGVVADTATVAGSSMDDIGQIMGKVTISNRATNRELQQLAERGIPVYTMLADEAGVSADAIFDMASRGEISADMLVDALENNLAGAALNAGDTVEGSMANLGASISRVGAGILAGVFAELPDFFQNITEALGPLEDAAKELGAELAVALAPALDSIVSLLPDLIGALLPALPAFADLLALTLELAVMVLPFLVEMFTAVVTGITSVINWMRENTTVVAGLGIAFGTAAVVLGAFAIAAKIKAVGGIVALVKGILTATKAQIGFNVALLANPIGLVVAAIAGLVAGLIYFFTSTETGKQVLQDIFEWFRGVPDALRGAWEGISGFFSDLWNGITVAFSGLRDMIVDGLNGIGEAVDNFATFIKEGAGRIMQGMLDGIVAGWQAVTEFFGNMATAIGDFFSNAANWLIDAGRNILNGLWEGIKFIWRLVEFWYIDMPRVILGLLASAATWLIETGRSVITGMWNGLKFVWETVSGWFSSLAGLVLGLLSDAGTWLFDVGKQVIDGFLNGLKNAWTAVTDWISGAAKRVSGAFKNILGIRSPSRVFFEFGENIGEGLLLGMQKMQPEIESHVDMMIKVPNVERAVDRQAQGKTMNYYAAPNQSLTAEQELMKAMRRARLVANW